MSKRGSSSVASPTKNKRVKVEHNQIRLDQFFESPKKTKPKVEDRKKSEKVPESAHGSSKQRNGPELSRFQLSFLCTSGSEVIDVDALDEGVDENVTLSTSSSSKLLSNTPKPEATGLGRTDSTDLSVIASSKDNVSTSSFSSSEPVLISHTATEAAETEVLAPLNVDPTSYYPRLPSGRSSQAPYSLLTLALSSLSQTRSRISIINILTNILRTIISNYPSSLLPTIYLLSNSLGPQFVPIELGLGSSIISSSIQQISGLSTTALRKLYNSTGDPGDVAYAAKSNIRTLVPHKPLTIPLVYESMIRISKCKGQGAAKEKKKIVEKLLLAANGEEARYLTRTLCQNLRVGAVRTSILTALARAFVLTPPPSVISAVTSEVRGDNIPHHVSQQFLTELTSEKSLSKSNREKLATMFKQAEGLIKQVYVKHPSYDRIIPVLLRHGLDCLAQHVPLTVGIPLLPMLGSPMRSLEQIYSRLGDLPFSAEYKYDGQRAQIHASRQSQEKCEIKIFSRHLEDMTDKYPDVVGLVETMFETSEDLNSFIIDAEIVAIDPSSGALKSFQELSGRARKDVDIRDVKISVAVFAFDIMYFNEQSLLEHTFRQRKNVLKERFAPFREYSSVDPFISRFNLVESIESEEGKGAIEEFMMSAIENRCEGLMIKLLDNPNPPGYNEEKRSRMKALPATYEPDVRTSGWLKLKKDYMEGMVDSLDLIPVGGWHGNGRKFKWWSPILLALWNPEIGQPVAMCKCMSGFTDTFYASVKEKFAVDTDLCSNTPLWECDFGGFKPDVYFKPCVVWEIRGADITESPVSSAAQGLVSSIRGLSLRFPRFIRIRNDKGIEQASTPAFLAHIWKAQQRKGKAIGSLNDEGDLIDIDVENSDFEELLDEDIDIDI